jgi:hypothetical protein
MLHGVGLATPLADGRRSSRSVWLGLFVLAPPLLLAIAALGVLVASLAGANPLWREADITLAEAAALRDRGAILRLVWDGADPNAAHYVRPRMLTSRALTVTPLEAAVGTRELYMVEFLLQHGARIDERDRPVLICLAAKAEAANILEFLKAGQDGQVPDCSHVETPW